MVIESGTDVPWYVMGIIHYLDGGGQFNTHLLNGDPLSARTVNIPAGRPSSGQPPFTWEESAIDGLQLMGLDRDKDAFSSIGAILYTLEKLNGFGYRKNHNVKSPYIWACTDVYTGGRYVSDAEFDASVWVKYCGAAALLKTMQEQNLFKAETSRLGLESHAVPFAWNSLQAADPGMHSQRSSSRASRPHIAVIRRVNIPTPAYPHVIAVFAVVAAAVLLLRHRDPALVIRLISTEVSDQ
jgi:lysozyme family protein